MGRFTTEHSIIELIDKYHLEVNLLKADAGQDDILADALRYTKEADRIRGLRDLAEKKRKQAAWREGRLETLKDKLAEFRTQHLPGCEANDGVSTS